MGPLTLSQLARDFSDSLVRVDALKPVWSPFQAGIGPHPEAEAVKLITNDMRAAHPERYISLALGFPYPDRRRQRCDVVIGDPAEWAVEIKLLRLLGDNGKANDNMLMHVLSPYPAHRSALTDVAKLRSSTFSCHLAILIYGFDYEAWPLEPAIQAFEVLALEQAPFLDRAVVPFEGLVHPVHQHGKVYAWEISQATGHVADDDGGNAEIRA
jgi:hypothetical protein